MSVKTSVTSAPLSTVSKPAQVQSNEIEVEVSAEQNLYANIVLVCSWAGIIIMTITFILYMGGLFHPMVRPSDMPQYWGMPVKEYLKATSAPSGWSWLTQISHADYLNLLGLAFIGSVSVLGYLTLFVNYMRKKDFTYAIMVTAEILILVLAASGIFHVGAG